MPVVSPASLEAEAGEQYSETPPQKQNKTQKNTEKETLGSFGEGLPD